jgi:hypothetical protein
MLLSELFMPKNYRSTLFNVFRFMGLDVAMGYPSSPPVFFDKGPRLTAYGHKRSRKSRAMRRAHYKAEMTRIARGY